MRLAQAKNELKAKYPELTQAFFKVENISVDVLFKAQELFKSSVSEDGKKLRLQYCAYDHGCDFTLFAYSVPFVKTVPSQVEYAEAS